MSESSSDGEMVLTEESSFMDDGTTTGEEASASKASVEEEELLAKAETQAVFRLRVLVILALLCAAVAVSLVVWFITSRAEDEDFETNFEGASTKLLDSFKEIVGQKMGAVASLGVSYTAYARSKEEIWPFVTMNDFQQRAASARSLSDALFLEILPIVTEEKRSEWEAYSLANKGWLDEGRGYQRKIGLDLYSQSGGSRNRKLEGNSFTGDNVLGFVSGNSTQESIIADKIWAFDDTFTPIAEEGAGPYFPIWQSSPVLVAPRDLVNWNLLGFPIYAPYIQLAAEAKVAIGGIDISPVGDITHEILTTSFFAFILSYAAKKNIPYEGDPFSSMYIPVFDSFDDDRKVVAVLVAVIQWATYFEGILPTNSEAVTVVLENTCEGPFTYRVSATSVDYLGKGDLHDTKYNEMEKKASFGDLIDIKEASQLGFELNQELCSYTLHVYPTQAFEDEYNTSMPIVITFAVAMVFVFTAAMFFVYDWLVERRQRLVMRTAEQTDNLVSSLFPEHMKKRLLHEKEEAGTNNSNNEKGNLKSFLNNGTNSPSGITAQKPLADLFLDTTVLFADISGFTAWSSVREPTQVFTLLESKSLFACFIQLCFCLSSWLCYRSSLTPPISF